MSKEVATKQDLATKQAMAIKQEQHAQVVLRDQLDKMDGEIEKVLPEHVSLDKFKRVVQTAITRNPDLMDADRRSLFAACLDAAQDGLLPDGREAALVVFNTKDKKTQTWIKKVQYMPMIAGIYKKVRNAGEISTLSSHIVYTGDDFDYWIDEGGPHLKHTPHLVGNRGQIMLVYAVCKLKDGSVEIEVMTTAEIEEVRQVSRAGDSGPWNTWWGEMARKTVTRRLSKRLPMSSDLDRLMRRDDSMYDLDREQRPAVDAPPRPKRVEYQPEPPAHGEDLDAEHRRVTTGYVGDDPEDETESASGPEGSVPAKEPLTEQGRDQRRTPAPAAEAAENGGQPSDMLANLRIGLGKQKSDEVIDVFLRQATVVEIIAELSEDEQPIWRQDVENAREALAQMA